MRGLQVADVHSVAVADRLSVGRTEIGAPVELVDSDLNSREWNSLGFCKGDDPVSVGTLAGSEAFELLHEVFGVGHARTLSGVTR